jgi:hypothetical protein
MRRIFAILALDAFLVSLCLAQWEKFNFPEQGPYVLLNTSNGLFGCGGRSIHRSTNNAQSWDSLSSFGTDASDMIGVGNVLLCSASFARIPEYLTPIPCLFRSEDFGQSWDTAMTAVYGVTSIASSGSTLYANPDGKLFSSVDSGRTWASVESASGMPDNITKIIVDGSTLYLLIQAEALYRSTDGGDSWAQLATGILPNFFYVIAHTHSVYVGSSSAGFFVSHDQGDTWEPMNTGLPGDSTGFRNLFLVGDYLLASVKIDSFERVYRLKLFDTTWTRFDEGLELTPYAWIYDCAINDEYIFLGAGWPFSEHSVWRRPLSELVSGVQEPSVRLPQAIYLDQNYPNPFNPSTTIRYSLPHRSHVTLSVFNTLGQHVATLVNGVVEAGSHEVHFNAEGFASAVYLLRLQAGGYTETKKLSLVR